MFRNNCAAWLAGLLLFASTGCAQVTGVEQISKSTVVSEHRYTEKKKGKLRPQNFEVEESFISAKVTQQKVCRPKVKQTVRKQEIHRRETKNVPVAITIGTLLTGAAVVSIVDAINLNSTPAESPERWRQTAEYVLAPSAILVGGGFLINGIQVARKGGDTPYGSPTTEETEGYVGEAETCGKTESFDGKFVAVYPETAEVSERVVDEWESGDGKLKVSVRRNYKTLCDAPERVDVGRASSGGKSLNIVYKSHATGDAVNLGAYDASDCLTLGRAWKYMFEQMSIQTSLENDKLEAVNMDEILRALDRIAVAREDLERLAMQSPADWIENEAEKLRARMKKTATILRDGLDTMTSQSLSRFKETFPENVSDSIKHGKAVVRALSRSSKDDSWEHWKTVYERQCSRETLPKCTKIYSEVIRADRVSDQCLLKRNSTGQQSKATGCPEWFQQSSGEELWLDFQKSLTQPLADLTENLSAETSALKASPTAKEYETLQSSLDQYQQLKKACSHQIDSLPGAEKACRELTKSATEAKNTKLSKMAVLATTAWKRLPGAEKAGMWRKCREEARGRLKAPATADFARFADISGEFTPINNSMEWAVRGFVDAENSFGAKLRSKVRCTFERTGGEFIFKRVSITN